MRPAWAPGSSAGTHFDAKHPQSLNAALQQVLPAGNCSGMILRKRSQLAGWCLLMAAVWSVFSTQSASLKTQNVFLIISDGFRWQEVFNGAETNLLNQLNGGVADPDALRAEFWRDTVEARRAALLPFFWNNIAHHGQLFGNRAKASLAAVTNGKKFSYPGYNEILTGWGDPRVDSNDKRPNPNLTVFEWLNQSGALRGRVSVLGTWDVFPYIFNVKRSQLPIWPAWETQFEPQAIRPPALVTELARDTTPMWDGVAYDSFLFHATLDHVQQKHPRLVFVGFGETDEWAHAGRYDHYLTAAHHMDDFVNRLWAATQSMDQYRDKTTFILTADHGRGNGLQSWRDHGEKVEGAENDWIAILGPDTPALGERTNASPVTVSQIAATIAVFLGEDYHRAFPQSGSPIAEVFPSGVLPSQGR
jgi:hypothetical protein